VGHGDIYVNPAVLEFLQWELIDQYRMPDFAVVTTRELSVLFEPDRDLYAPGEIIDLMAQVLGAEDETGHRPPVEEATIEVQLAWQGALPGDEPPSSAAGSVGGWLSPGVEPGGYTGQLQAPEQEGYYQLTATVEAMGAVPITLSELIVVEREMLA
jgi:hypothetical protein